MITFIVTFFVIIVRLKIIIIAITLDVLQNSVKFFGN